MSTWRVAWKKDQPDLRIVTEKDETVAFVPTGPDQQARAELLADAPALLEILRRYVKETDGRTGGELYDAAVAAIAKHGRTA